jgi:hypothetical protein
MHLYVFSSFTIFCRLTTCDLIQDVFKSLGKIIVDENKNAVKLYEFITLVK